MITIERAIKKRSKELVPKREEKKEKTVQGSKEKSPYWEKEQLFRIFEAPIIFLPTVCSPIIICIKLEGK